MRPTPASGAPIPRIPRRIPRSLPRYHRRSPSFRQRHPTPTLASLTLIPSLLALGPRRRAPIPGIPCCPARHVTAGAGLGSPPFFFDSELAGDGNGDDLAVMETLRSCSWAPACSRQQRTGTTRWPACAGASSTSSGAGISFLVECNFILDVTFD